MYSVTRIRASVHSCDSESGWGMRLTMFVVGILAAPVSAEWFVDVGAQFSEITSEVAAVSLQREESGVHLGIGVRRAYGERHDLGARVEFDKFGSDFFLAVRALDYRYHVFGRFTVNAFLGAARLDLATPAYGFYGGVGVQWKDVIPRWDLTLDLRYGDKIARDKIPSDPQGGRSDSFHDVRGISVYLSRRF